MSELPTVDWDSIGRDMADTCRKMIIDERWISGDAARYAEALRRVLGYRPADPSDHRSVDRINTRLGLTTEAAHRRDLAGAVALAEAQRDAAENQAAEMREEARRVHREARQDIADLLRNLASRQTSKYRREGVVWAADMIDPRVPKDEYGRPVDAPRGDA